MTNATQPAAVVQSATTPRRWMAYISTAILGPALLLVIVEIALRAGGVGFPSSVMVPCTIQGSPASCYNIFFSAPFFPPGMIRTPAMYSVPAEKRGGTFRIVVLGESAAKGDPEPAYGFSRYLEVMLKERFPDMNFEVINTGSVAINSHVSLLIAKELAKYHHPDLFIIYSGNNEVIGPYGPGTALASSTMSLPVIRASIFLRSTRTGQLLTKVGTQKREWRGMEMFLDKQVRASSPLMKPAYENFESNLRDTIAAARGAGAMVIVSTVATNLKDCAPFASLHREDLPQDTLRSWSELVQQGGNQESAGAYGEALKLYLAAETIDGQYAELEFRIARCLWMLKDYPAAKQHFIRARDLDTLRFRADSKINEVNRAVASASQGVALVDAEEIFSGESPNAVIGSELVYEHVHMTPEGSYLLARAMFRQIGDKLEAKAGHAPTDADVPSQADCERLLALTGHDRHRVTMQMLQRVQKPPFTNQLNHSEQVMRLMIKASAASESPGETAAQYQWALARRPDDRTLHYNYGLFLFEHDRAAAAEQFRMSRPWDGFPVMMPDGMLVERLEAAPGLPAAPGRTETARSGPAIQKTPYMN